MKLYVDDIREAPDESWTLVRTITEAINFIMFYGEDITDISLDHDISHEVRINGQYRPFPYPENYSAVACFLCKYYEQVKDKPTVWIHTANPDGAKKIEALMLFYDIPYVMNMMGQAHRKK